MFENLSEQAKTYVAYAGIAITSAAVGALILLAGQGINNWRHPQVPASAVTDDMLRATQDANVEELQAQVDELDRQTQALTDAQTTAQRALGDAQRIVTEAGTAATPEQQTALTDARTAFENAQAALAEHNKRITNLRAQIAVNGVLANADQRAILVDRINHLAPVAPAAAAAEGEGGSQ